MRKFLNPKWTLLLNTLPISIFFFLFFGIYSIIQSQLDGESLYLWKIFFGSLMIMTLISLFYTIFLEGKGGKLNVLYGMINLIGFTTFLYLFSFHFESIIPFSIPRWMVANEVAIYAGTFLMPTIAHSLMIIVVHFTPEEGEHQAWKSFMGLIAVPILVYVFFQIIIPLSHGFGDNQHFFFILFISTSMFFFFFLLRWVYILSMKKSRNWSKIQLSWQIPITIMFPIAGLLVNHMLGDSGWGDFVESGFFGNFGSPWFFGLALLNGILICLPDTQHRIYRWLLFIGRSILFSFSIYFLVVFLPFLPLSVGAILVLGAGFLMLTPLLLFVIHVGKIKNDIKYLLDFHSKVFLNVLSVILIFVIPTIMTIRFSSHRAVVAETLDYLYSPDYGEKSTIDISSLAYVLSSVKGQKDRNTDFIMTTQIPYISRFYNWLVLDNMVLPDSKIKTIEQVFFGETDTRVRTIWRRNDKIKEVSDINIESTYSKENNTWTSWVNMEIVNTDSIRLQREFATVFNLPTGCYISDYYLYVGDHKEYGILAEKKAALWIYDQIVNTRKDPGLLNYLSGNRIAFRVFPFSALETRKTGIQFIHKGRVELEIAGETIVLGESPKESDMIKMDGIQYLSSDNKRGLEVIAREPYYHFILDVSKNAITNDSFYKERINDFLKTNTVFEGSKITLCNYDVEVYNIDENWEDRLSPKNNTGGFYLDRAIKSILVDSYKNPTEKFPVIIVLTDSFEHAVLDDDYLDLSFTFPDTDKFYNLTTSNRLESHSLVFRSSVSLDTLSTYQPLDPVLKWVDNNGDKQYLSYDSEPDILTFMTDHKTSFDNSNEDAWMTGLKMEATYRDHLLHPKRSNEEWLSMLKLSFGSQIMNPYTAYMVVENEAQKAMLLKKQKQAMNGNKSLDLGEDPSKMSEPSLIVLVIGLLLFLWYRRKREEVLSL